VRKALSRVGVLLTATIVLAGCTAAEQPAPESTAPVVQLGAPGESNRTLSPEDLAQLDLTVPHSDEDVAFVRDMLHHHSQALEMTALVPDRAGSDDVRLMAERMDISQTDEMALMERWLQERGEAVRDPDAMHDMHDGMPGLLTEAELADLEAASGAEFDRLFLEFMIRHHQGALEMVTTLFDSGGGMEMAIGQIAREVEADQSIEIARMQGMLAEGD
jgi:uncharacterized protein (DUF305 family)